MRVRGRLARAGVADVLSCQVEFVWSRIELSYDLRDVFLFYTGYTQSLPINNAIKEALRDYIETYQKSKSCLDSVYRI